MYDKSAAKNGRYGDTEILHVSPREKAFVVPLLKAMGGAGTRNPKDGALEFYEDAGGSGNPGPVGQGGHNDLGGSNRAGGNGGNAGNRGGSGIMAGHTNYSGGVTPSGGWGSNILGHGLGVGPMGNDVSITHQRALGNPNFANQPDPSQASLDSASAYGAYHTPGFKGWAARNLGAFGFGEVAPREDQPASYAQGTYHFGVNPAGFVGGVLGAATGVPAVGSLMGKAYDLFGGKSIVLGGPGGIFGGGGTPAAAPMGGGAPAYGGGVPAYGGGAPAYGGGGLSAYGRGSPGYGGVNPPMGGVAPLQAGAPVFGGAYQGQTGQPASMYSSLQFLPYLQAAFGG